VAYEPVFPVSVGDVWVMPVPFGFPVGSLPVTANAALVANATDTMVVKPSVCIDFMIRYSCPSDIRENKRRCSGVDASLTPKRGNDALSQHAIWDRTTPYFSPASLESAFGH
jgi:hypothetical protein